MSANPANTPTAQANQPDPNKVTKEDFKRESQLATNFKIVRKVEDPRFGPIAIIKTPSSDRLIAVREKKFGDVKELSDEILEIKKRLQIRDPRLLTLLDFSTGEKSDFCSTSYWIKIFFEYPDHDIDQELRRRNTQAGFAGFTSYELTHMLYNILQAGKVLNDNGRYHGDISPDCIEMDTPENYKLVEVFGELSKPELHQSQRLIAGGNKYSAPEVYQKLLNGTLTKGNEKGPKAPQLVALLRQADVFSLAITLLHAGTDEGVHSVYKKDGTIDRAQLENLKSKFATKFARNNLLTSTVFAMLDENLESRPKDLASVLEALPPYDTVKQSINLEKARELQVSAVSNQGYGAAGNLQTYLAQTQWEQHWMQGQGELPRQQAPPANSPLLAHLPTPAPVPTTNATQPTTASTVQSQTSANLSSIQAPAHNYIRQQPAVSYITSSPGTYHQIQSAPYYHPLSVTPTVHVAHGHAHGYPVHQTTFGTR